MNYEIVNLEEKTLVGVTAVTGNSDPQMADVIRGLWEKLYHGGINGTIQNKVNTHAIGLYSEYSGDTYRVTAGNEVSQAGNPELDVKRIPAGRYARFSVHGHMEHAVAEAWQKIWAMELDRSFTGDFEEYLNDSWDHADIDIYIALK